MVKVKAHKRKIKPKFVAIEIYSVSGDTSDGYLTREEAKRAQKRAIKYGKEVKWIEPLDPYRK